MTWSPTEPKPLKTLAELVDEFFPAPIDPEPPKLLEPPTEKDFEQHKVLLQTQRVAFEARLAQDLKTIEHYSAMKAQALGWRFTVAASSPKELRWKIEQDAVSLIAFINGTIEQAESSAAKCRSLIAYYKEELERLSKRSWFQKAKNRRTFENQRSQDIFLANTQLNEYQAKRRQKALDALSTEMDDT